MNITDDTTPLRTSLEVSLTMARNGQAYLTLRGGKIFTIFEPTHIGQDFIRFAISDRQASTSMMTVPFSSILHVQTD